MIHVEPDDFLTTVPVTISTGLYARHGKRLFDLGFALFLIPLLMPVIGLLWLLARADGGAGFYGHQRVGKDGRRFRCWKIRTMAVDADRRLADLLRRDPQAAREWASTFKLKNDPRVTRLGGWLRRTSLDELPQIWNVLRGEMSFVGPRPVTPEELSYYGPDKGSYLALRPGITGLWQVRGRSDGNYVQRVLLDRHYGERLRLASDVLLIAQTSLLVLRPTGS